MESSTSSRPPSNEALAFQDSVGPKNDASRDTTDSAQPKAPMFIPQEITDSSSRGITNEKKSITPPTPSQNENPPRSVTGLRWFLVCMAIYSANLLYGLDNTIVADIQADIAAAFDNDVAHLGWLGVGFTLGSSVLILPLGRAYGQFDTKWVLIGCLTNFTAGSALCGAAQNMTAMIVGRVWAGAGGAGMYLGTLNLCMALCKPKELALFLSMTGIWYGIGCIVGPVLGGLLTDSSATWRWGFYMNIVIFAAMLPIYLFLLPSVPKQTDISTHEKLINFDWLGVFLIAGGCTCFTVAFTSGGPAWGWTAPATLALIALFVLFFLAFAITQYFSTWTSPSSRLFPCDLFRDRRLLVLYIIMSCSGAALLAAVYYIPLYYLFVHGSTGTQAALHLLPYIGCYVGSVLIAGSLITRIGYPMLWFLASGLMLTAGSSVIMAILYKSSGTSLPNDKIMAVCTAVVGLGMMTSQAPYSVGGALVNPDRASEVIQFINISQGSSQLISLAVASTIFQTCTSKGMKDVLGSYGFSDEKISAAISGARSTVLDNVSTEVRREAIRVVVRGIGKVWVIVVVVGVVYTACSIALGSKRGWKKREN